MRRWRRAVERRLPSGVAEHRIEQAREVVVRGAELGLVDAAELSRLLIAAVDRAQAVGQRGCSGSGRAAGPSPAACASAILICVENEIEVGADEMDARRRLRWCPARRPAASPAARRDVDDRRGRGGEHLSPARRGHPVDGLDAQRQAGEVRRHPEGGAARALEREIAARQEDDVLEHARAGTRSACQV